MSVLGRKIAGRILGGVPYRERVKSRRTNINNNVKGKLLVSTYPLPVLEILGEESGSTSLLPLLPQQTHVNIATNGAGAPTPCIQRTPSKIEVWYTSPSSITSATILSIDLALFGRQRLIRHSPSRLHSADGDATHPNLALSFFDFSTPR
jgi:hypothetical protein